MHEHLVGDDLHKGYSRKSLMEGVSELGYYRELAQVKDIGELNKMILGSLEKLGFSDFTFCRLGATPHLESQLLTTIDDIIKQYEIEAFHEHDIMLKHVETKATPLYMSAIEGYVDRSPFETEMFQRNSELIRLCNSFGFYDFYSVPVDSFDGLGRVVLGVSAKGMSKASFVKHVRKNSNQLRYLAKAIDYIGTRKFPHFFLGTKDSPNIVISPRPLQLLTVMAEDNLLLKQAADQLNIGIDTANKHMAAMKQALGANTPASAVYRAIKEGLIDCN